MASEIRVPTLGESVTEATIAQWYKKPGEAVSMDEPLCELETDKVTIEVPAQSAGVLEEVLFEEGATVEVGALLGSIDAEGTPAAPAETPAAKPRRPGVVQAYCLGESWRGGISSTSETCRTGKAAWSA